MAELVKTGRPVVALADNARCALFTTALRAVRSEFGCAASGRGLHVGTLLAGMPPHPLCGSLDAAWLRLFSDRLLVAVWFVACWPLG